MIKDQLSIGIKDNQFSKLTLIIKIFIISIHFLNFNLRLLINIIIMLRILLRSSLYFARRVKRERETMPKQQIVEDQYAPKSHNLRSQFKQMKQMFIDLDKNEGKQQEQDKNLNLSLEFFKKMIKEDKNDKQQKIKQKQKIPLQEKLRQLGTPQHLIKKVQQKSLNNLEQKGKINKYIEPKVEKIKLQKSPLIQQLVTQAGTNIEQLERKMNIDLKLAHQQLILDQIMKKSKEKEVKLNIEQAKNPESQQQYQKRLVLRRQKIIQSLQNRENIADAKLDFTTEDLLAMKYSPQILAKARQYKNNELMYFKQLINNEDAENNRNSRLHKRHYKDQKDEQRYLQQLHQIQSAKVPELENSYKKIKQEEGLKIYQGEQFYKNKAIRQIKEKNTLTPQDLKLKQQLQKDLQLGDKISDVFLDQVVYQQEAKIQKRIAYSQTSFGKQDNQIRELNKRLDNLGIDFSQDQIKSLSKQLLFEQKHFLQVQQGFQKYLQRKQKKKNMKKQLREVHKNVLKDDVDFDKQQQAVMSVKQVRESSDTALLQDNFQKMQQYQSRKQAVLVQMTPQEKQSEIHHKKTFKNMENFLALYFANGLLNHNSNQLNDIELLEIKPNAVNTVMNVFWNISKQYLSKQGIIPGSNNYQQKFQRQKIKLEKRLKNQSNYISGKMTQLLRLRYGPQIRFFFDTKTKKTIDAIQQLGKYTKQIAMVELQQYTKKGLIKSQEEQMQYYEKLLNVAKGKLDQFNSRTQLLSKKYQKFHKVQPIVSDQTKQTQSKENIKKKRKNPVLQDQIQLSKEAKLAPQLHRKKKPSQKLWDSIDLL